MCLLRFVSKIAPGCTAFSGDAFGRPPPVGLDGEQDVGCL
jgi:hypothetical protein